MVQTDLEVPIPFICAVRLVPTWIMVRRLKREDYEALGRGARRLRAQSTLLSIILVTILVLEFGSIAVLGAEWHAIDSNIKTAHRLEVQELRARLAAFESAQQPDLRQPSDSGTDPAISGNG